MERLAAIVFGADVQEVAAGDEQVAGHFRARDVGAGRTVFWKRTQENITLTPMWFAMRIQSEMSERRRSRRTNGDRERIPEVHDGRLSAVAIADRRRVIATPLSSAGGSIRACPFVLPDPPRPSR